MAKGAKTTSKDVRTLLHNLGLDVTDGMLKQDVRDGYLPHPEGRGPKPGLWEPWAVRRAVYLYRLRRLGVTGDLLRVLLFLQDGRMWEGVRPIAEKGFRKIMHGTLIPARPHRSNRRTRPFDAEEYGPGATVGGVKVGLRAETAAFTWGMLLDGAPAAGGTITPIITMMAQALGLPGDQKEAVVVERVLGQLGITRERLEQAAEQADERIANRARVSLRWLLRRIRRFVRGHMTREIGAPRSSNPLAMFGVPRDQLAKGLRDFPGRLTPAQALAAWLVPLAFFHTCAESGMITAALAPPLHARAAPRPQQA
jgi:hypothetical protein